MGCINHKDGNSRKNEISNLEIKNEFNESIEIKDRKIYYTKSNELYSETWSLEYDGLYNILDYKSSNDNNLHSFICKNGKFVSLSIGTFIQKNLLNLDSDNSECIITNMIGKHSLPFEYDEKVHGNWKNYINLILEPYWKVYWKLKELLNV